MRVKPEFLKLAAALRTSPMCFADIFGVNPERLEQLLQKRGQAREDESIYATVQRHYGNRVAEGLWHLVGICPFISEKDSSKEK